MKFSTFTGSVYEVDDARKLVRRLHGVKAPTERLGEAWAEFGHRTPVRLGQLVAFYWPEGTKLLVGSPEGSTPVTMTSLVQQIWPDGDPS